MGKILHAAVQGGLSEPNFTIVLLVDVPCPVRPLPGELRLAQERGFARYRGDVYDCMARCEVGLDVATDDDPLALSYLPARISAN